MIIASQIRAWGSLQLRAAVREAKSHPLLPIVLGAYGVALLAVVAHALMSGSFFGGDPGEYLLTGQGYLSGTHDLFTYPYPLLPILYIPWILVVHDPLTLFQIADVLSAVLLLGVTLSSYVFIRRLGYPYFPSLVGALMVGTAPIMLDSVGWGGQAQMVAMILGTLALSRTVGWKGIPTPREALVPGLFVAVAILAEPYAAAFFATAIALDLLLRWRGRLFSGRGFLAGVVLASAPVVAGAVLVVLQGNVAANALSSTLASETGNGGLWVDLIVRLTFGDPFLALAYAGLILLYGVWGRSYGSFPGVAGPSYLTPALGLAVGIEAVVLTPSAFADRFLYFVPLPLGLLAAQVMSVAPGWPVQAPEVAAAPRRPRSNLASQTTPFLPFLVAFVLLIQVGAASTTYPASLVFYGEANGGLTDLTFIRGENGSLLYVDPNVDMFPASFASGQDLYPTVQPFWFTQSSQQAAAVEALTLTAGDRWIDAGATRVVDSQPSIGTGSPSILSNLGGNELDVLRLNDSGADLSLRSTTNGSSHATALSYAPSIVSRVADGGVTDAYAWTGVWVNKSITTQGDGIAVDIDFTASEEDWTGVNLTLDSPDCSILGVTTTAGAGGGAWANVSQAYQGPWTTTFFDSTLEALGTNTSSVNITPSYNPSGLPNLWLRFSVDPGHTQVQIRLWIRPPTAVAAEPTITLEVPAMKQDGIRWVVLHLPASQEDIGRFMDDSALVLYETTSSYDIFEVGGP